MSTKLSFHGGVGTVTGSRYLLQSGNSNFLVDGGLFQGLRKLRRMNWRLPGFDPTSIQRVLLTHAHIDHAGYLPRLVRLGMDCPIWCTKGTLDLAGLLLLDSAHLQEEDAAFANRKGFSKHKPALPLYTRADAEATLALMRAVDYGEWIEAGAGIRARFLNMGHILGSAMVEARIAHDDGEMCVVFSGDVGRYDALLHSDPDPLPACDALVIESTYGDREHDNAPVEDQILAALEPVLARGGTALIPSFAVGRAQLVTLSLRRLINAGRMPDVPIHIDSPMAVDATRLYSRYIKDLSLDEDLTDDGRSQLFPHNVHFCRSVEDSKQLNLMGGPRIVISASGMLAGGRVLHHLKRLLPDANNLIMLVGYQAAGTRGRRMIDGASHIRIHGEDVPIKAEFLSIGGLSAHADRTDLLRWVRTSPDGPRRIFVTHGEPDSAASFAELLRKETGATVDVPALDDAYELVG